MFSFALATGTVVMLVFRKKLTSVERGDPSPQQCVSVLNVVLIIIATVHAGGSKKCETCFVGGSRPG